MDDFRVELSISGSGAVVYVHGELDAATAPLLDDELRKAEAAAADADVVVDLAGVSFLDSSGLSVLVAGHKRARARESTLVVANPSSSTRRLFEISGLDGVLTVR